MLVALAALLLISGALAGVADVNYGSDSLRVATDAANPPYSPSPGSSDVGGQPVLPAANERVFVQQTVRIRNSPFPALHHQPRNPMHAQALQAQSATATSMPHAVNARGHRHVTWSQPARRLQ